MKLNTLDPNEPENCSNSQEILDQTPPEKPVQTRAEDESKLNLHPVLTVLGSYLKKFSIIERWTIQEDLLEHVLEVRITLSRPQKK